MSVLKLLMKSRAAAATQNVEDVFSTYLTTGTGAELTVTTNVDLSTGGGMVWTKSRSAATGNRLTDTARTAANELITDSTAASAAAAQGVKSFSTTGFVLGTDTDYNNSTGPVTYVHWSFAVANNFFHVSSNVKAAGVDKTVDLSALGTVGMVAVKRTDDVGSWYVWHRSLTAGSLLYLEQTAAEAVLGHITMSGTTLTLEDGVIADGTYIVYAWAHDTATDGLIQCGSFTTDGSGNASVTLGWEPQYIVTKVISTTGGWRVFDTARGLSYGNDALLVPSGTNAEYNAEDYGEPSATGINIENHGASLTWVYLAIRRGPMAQPTVGTQVYNAVARTGTGAAATVTGVGFPPDLVIVDNRDGSASWKPWIDRLRGVGSQLFSYNTNAESTGNTTDVTSFDMSGMSLGVGPRVNVNTATYINWFLRRYPGVFDQVCWTGAGVSTTSQTHNLGVIPELKIIKNRTTAERSWIVAGSAIAPVRTNYLLLESTAAVDTTSNFWDAADTSTTFSVRANNGNAGGINGDNYVAYLFATLAGISKVGTYTGNGTNQTINCGFSTGARFVLIKRTDSTGNWVVFDSTRGIVAGNDPYLLLNSTAAEDTDEDAVDADNSGFIVNETTAANVNTNLATYIYLAFA